MSWVIWAVLRDDLLREIGEFLNRGSLGAVYPDARFCAWSIFVGLIGWFDILQFGWIGLNRQRAWMVVVAFLGGAAGLVLAGPGLDTPIGDQLDTQRTSLSNGLEVVVSVSGEQKTDVVQAWLIVRAGSMYESDEQRGAAGVLEAAIRMGTAHFSVEEIDAILSDSETGYGQRTGSLVTFDHSVYMAAFSQDDREGLERVLGVFADVLNFNALGLDDAKIDASTAELIARIEDEPSPELRARQGWLPELLGGTPIGDRLPSASIESLEALGPDSVRDFARAYQHPAQATLIVVGQVDADEIVEIAGEMLGKIPGGDRRPIVDGRTRVDLSMRAAIGSDPGLEQEQGAMIWFKDRGDETLDGWSKRAGQYARADIRRIVIERVAGEIVRYRLGRLSVHELGSGLDLGVEQLDLWGQLDVMQIGIESGSESEEENASDSDTDWADSLGFLVRQCDRFTRDGASVEEIKRARRSVLSRWHRDADDWVNGDTHSKMSLVHWLVTTGRPVIDMVRWDQLATELMSEINDEEIDRAVRGLVDPRSAAYVAIVPSGNGPSGPGGSDMVLEVVKDGLLNPMDPIDPLWMNRIAGDLLDEKPTGGRIEEVSQHPGSGVWSAVLSNGVRVRVKGSDGESDQPDRISLSASLWSSAADAPFGLDDELLDAGMEAWREPTSEMRSHQMISTYMKEHDLVVRTRRGVGYIQLRVDGPRGAFEQAAELMFVLLDRPMIEGDAFSRWQQERNASTQDPLDRGVAELYAAHSIKSTRKVRRSLDDAQRALTQIVRNSQIDIGIAGVVDAQGALEESSEIFGTLVDRQRVDSTGQLWAPSPNSIAGERVVRVGVGSPEEQGVVVGYIGASARDLDMLRALTLAAIVLDERIDQEMEAQGIEGKVYTQTGYAQEVPGRVLLMIRARCESDEIVQINAIVGEVIAGLAGDGITEDELAQAQGWVIESIDRYFDSPMYWSQRLSTLGIYGRGVDDLWTIREGYRSIDTQEVSRVFAELIASNERFRVEIVQSERGQ
jgi:predicted Zn-dependent peptidase